MTTNLSVENPPSGGGIAKTPRGAAPRGRESTPESVGQILGRLAAEHLETHEDPRPKAGVKLYRYGFSLAYALLVGNYVAWATGFLDWRCLVGAMLAAVIGLVASSRI